MSDFNIRSESVDVEQIMRQIRARISEKRGTDYTEEQVRELATVKLEKFLDPKNLRSDLLEQFRRSRPAIHDDPPPVQAPYEFNDETLFVSHRGPLRFIRKLLKPILKLFFNPNTLNQVLHTQAQFNVDLLKREQRRRIEFERSRGEWNALYYEVLHNLVLETTRNGIELKNLKMRVESLASRLDFSERRVRALEGVVQYRPEAFRPRDRDRDRDRDKDRDRNNDRPRPQRSDDAVEGAVQDPALVPTGEGSPHGQQAVAGAPGESRRRRRRRRGRRGSVERPEERTSAEDSDEMTAGGDPEDAASTEPPLLVGDAEERLPLEDVIAAEISGDSSTASATLDDEPETPRNSGGTDPNVQ